ncbi:MAG TPA: response regulator [Polyangiaceae bacterium]|nr:response regulator [Polyangiaceae bacterium]
MTRVLIVEDSATQAEELAYLLESRQFEVVIRRDGLSGLEYCRTEAVDVVLSDVIMPGIDGYELCRRLKTEEGTRDLPVILLTSLTDPLDIIRGLECQADNFVTKPYDVDYLVARVNQLLENRRLRSQRKVNVGVDLVLMGRRFTINSEKEQMIDLLLSTFEEVLRSRQREYEAKVAQETHRRSHKLLQSALDALSSQIATVDDAGEIVATNAAWRRMGELSGWRWPAAGVGQDYRVVLEQGFGAAREHALAALEGVEAVRRGEREFFHLEYPAQIAGVARWHSIAATCFEGNGVRMLALENEDITGRKQATEEVRRSELALRRQTHILNSILNSMSEGIIVADREGGLLLTNRRAEESLGVRGGMTREQWIPILEPYQPDSSDAESEAKSGATSAKSLNAAMLGELQGEFDVSSSGPDAKVLAVSGAPLKDEAGTLDGSVMVVRDVTQQRKLEQQLRQAQKMEAIGQLAGGVAHDFNNLLSVITSYGQLMLRDLAEGDSKREDMEQMLEAAKRASGLTRQLLSFSRRQLVHATVLDLNQVVENVEKMLRRIIGEDIDLETVLSPELSRIKADAGQIEQVLLNLSVNARDAMPRGGKLTIQTSNVVLSSSFSAARMLAKSGPFVLLTVSDTGVGMDSATQARIFEPFFTTKEVGKGTGLGLSTVYGIVNQTGGHIWVYSELGCGTTFKVYLPAVDEELAAQTVAPPKSPTPANEQILLVEDEEAVRQVAARILREEGYRVLVARGAAEARALCKEVGGRVDLLLSDVVMRDTTGPDLAAELSAVYPHLRVLYMSGYSEAAVFRHGSLENGAAFLEKPFAPESLTRKVREVLETPR